MSTTVFCSSLDIEGLLNLPDKLKLTSNTMLDLSIDIEGLLSQVFTYFSKITTRNEICTMISCNYMGSHALV